MSTLSILLLGGCFTRMWEDCGVMSDCEELVGVSWRLSDCEELVGSSD